MDAGIRQYAVKLVKPVTQTSKDRRVSHAAVVKNKRLGPALALRKLQQELRHETKIQSTVGKEATGSGRVSAPIRLHRNALTPKAMELY